MSHQIQDPNSNPRLLSSLVHPYYQPNAF